MSDELIGGIRVQGNVSLREILEEVVQKTLVEVDQIKAVGLEITHVCFTSRESPARIYFKFPPDRMQWQVRKQLEDHLFDVGQQFGLGDDLAFYASKRITETKGWGE